MFVQNQVAGEEWFKSHQVRATGVIMDIVPGDNGYSLVDMRDAEEDPNHPCTAIVAVPPQMKDRVLSLKRGQSITIVGVPYKAEKEFGAQCAQGVISLEATRLLP